VCVETNLQREVKKQISERLQGKCPHLL